MTRQISRIITLVACAGLIAGATGCKCIYKNECAKVCEENKEAGLPTILCQPLDTMVGEKESATFNVTAVGKDLAYQWYRNGDPLADKEGFKGANQPQLFVSDLPGGKVGNYFCRIVSTDSSELPISTDTRVATLGIVQRSQVEALTIQHQPPPPGGPSGKCICGVYRAYMIFPAGFKPAAKQTLAHAQATFSNGANLKPSDYNLLWQTSILDRGCATDSTNSLKSFSCNPAKTYKFTVYFVNWPLPGSAGAGVILNVQ
jgi:hypothetical protein